MRQRLGGLLGSWFMEKRWWKVLHWSIFERGATGRVKRLAALHGGRTETCMDVHDRGVYKKRLGYFGDHQWFYTCLRWRDNVDTCRYPWQIIRDCQSAGNY